MAGNPYKYPELKQNIWKLSKQSAALDLNLTALFQIFSSPMCFRFWLSSLCQDKKVFPVLWKSSQTEKIISSLDLVSVPCPAPYWNPQFCSSVKDVKKEEFWHSRACKDCSCSRDKGEGTRREMVSDIAPPVNLIPACFSFLSTLSKPLLEPIWEISQGTIVPAHTRSWWQFPLSSAFNLMWISHEVQISVKVSFTHRLITCSGSDQ